MSAKAIRNDIIDRLSNAITAVGSRVYPARAMPSLLNNLPAIVVNTPQRSARTIDHTAGTEINVVNVEINVIVAQTDDYLDDCDDILDEVRATLFGDEDWWDQYDDVAGYDEEVSLFNEGEKPIAVGVLRFTVQEMDFYQ